MPDIRLEDTIAAIATPIGEGGIGVIRLSGAEAISIASKMFRKQAGTGSAAGQVSEHINDETCPGQNRYLIDALSHTLHHGYIINEDQSVIDEVVVSIFKNPKSYTGEDVIEISGHGGARVLQKILDLSFSLGCRPAEPGEFTKRAFLNGKMDLAQAEAVLDLIRAKTDRSLEVALRQLSGKLSGEVNSIKDELMHIYAHLEAYLDFPDEHLEIYSNQEFKLRFEQAQKRLSQLIDTYSKGEILREGASVILCGRPNVGKSSLLNAFLDRDRAIVSEVPGTTRDIIEESLELDGLWVRIVDTAGLWSSEQPLDQAAMDRTKRFVQDGDILLWILDAAEGLLPEDLEILEQFQNRKWIAVVNKSDLDRKNFSALEKFSPNEFVYVSAKTRQGLDELSKRITKLIFENQMGQESVLITRLRHKKALEVALESVRKSFKAFLKSESLEFVTLDLKFALDSLKEFVGEIYTEDLLDVIFKEFCIGK